MIGKYLYNFLNISQRFCFFFFYQKYQEKKNFFYGKFFWEKEIFKITKYHNIAKIIAIVFFCIIYFNSFPYHDMKLLLLDFHKSYH